MLLMQWKPERTNKRQQQQPRTELTNDLFGIAASGWIRTTINTIQYNTIQYNTIKSIQYYTRPRLIVISNSMRAAAGPLAPPRVTVGGPGDVILKGSKKIRNRWPVSTTPLSFGATARGTPANIRICRICPETTIIGLQFDTDGSQCSWNFEEKV